LPIVKTKKMATSGKIDAAPSPGSARTSTPVITAKAGTSRPLDDADGRSQQPVKPARFACAERAEEPDRRQQLEGAANHDGHA